MHMYTLITSKGVPKYECYICIHELSLNIFMRRCLWKFYPKEPHPPKKQNETKRDSWPHLVLQTYAYHDLEQYFLRSFKY